MTDSFASFERKTVIYVIIVATFVLLVFRLFQMQILQHQIYDEKSADNSIKAIEQIPLRGVFLDRNLEVVVSNIPAYTMRITPADYDTRLNRLLETVLDVDSGYINKILFNNRVYSKYIPIKIKRGIDFKVVSWLEENMEHLQGVDYIVEMQRGYPAGVIASHMFGYTKEIPPQQLEKEKSFYNPGDYVGHNGIEKSYEERLRGEKGYNFILVDSKRREIGKYKDGTDDKPSAKGSDLVLSIDADVQRAAEIEFADKRGAAVAIEPSTGEVLALMSAPEYDLNQFSYFTSKDFLQNLYNDPDKPLFNRATMSLKPPGSTFKIMAALAALDMGVITTSTTFYCGGGFTFGRFFKCHGSHGTLNVIHAIEKSCNSFFYQLIFRIGLDKLAEYSKRMGFGKKTNIDIGEEAAGFIPTPDFYAQQYKTENWPKGILPSLGIGQGEISVTPLQLAFFTSLVANNGKSKTPHIVKGIRDSESKKISLLSFKNIDAGVSQSAFDIVKEGMFLVVNGAGTATHIRSEKYKIAGKTGTAQNPHGKDHALFIGFAPADDPKIAVAVVVENAGFGGTHAAPIAKKMIEICLNKLDSKMQKEVGKQNQQILRASLEN